MIIKKFGSIAQVVYLDGRLRVVINEVVLDGIDELKQAKNDIVECVAWFIENAQKPIGEVIDKTDKIC